MLKGNSSKAATSYDSYDAARPTPFSHRYRVDMKLELAHYRRCSEILRDDADKSDPGFAMRRARLLFQTGDLKAAETVVLKVGLKQDGRMGLHLSNTLGLIRLKRGLYAEAEKLFESRLKLPRKADAKIDEPETILALDGAALAYVGTGSLNAAAECANKALELATNSWGHFSIPALDAMDTLAAVRIAQHDFTQARKLLEDCARERPKLYGPVNPKVADTLDSQARFDPAMGDGQNALKLAEHAMEIRQQIFGGPNLWPAQALLTKGDIYAAAGALNQATRCYDNAVPVLETSLGADTPAVSRARAWRDSIHAKLTAAASAH